MTNTTGLKLLQPFIKQCEESNDPYFIVHFSREDDHFKGYHDGLDMFDAAIIVKHLIEAFGREVVLASVGTYSATA